MKVSSKKLAYTIYADIGIAPWAWVKEASDTSTNVGANCADSSGWSGYHDIPNKLEKDFVKWAVFFDSKRWYVDPDLHKTFDWETFNSDGIELAKRLKQVVGHKALVYYCRPSEELTDDNYRLEILNDCDTRSFTPKKFLVHDKLVKIY